MDAGQLAGLLEHKRIPVCILNACQSAKQDSSAQNTSLGMALIEKGIQHVLGMRYSVSVSAAKLMMATLYRELYRQQPVDQAVAAGRKELGRVQERRAAYNRQILLEDWLLPVLYQNGKQSLNLRKPTPEEEIAFIRKRQVPPELRQELTYGFFGRDLDILKIEKNILLRSNILLLQGMGGAGKTTLLRYLAAWWLRTGFIQNVFYFGYDVKAYSLNEIIYTIARKIYSNIEYGTFTGLPADVQEAKVVKELRINRYALILDNTESITGEKLAIPNTLPAEERVALKAFLAQLKGGQTAVIIGSRASEDWLRPGTFDNNHYLLRGLDPESAANFANKILETVGVGTKAVVNDGHFQTLLKLLAGYPLALKAILPNLRTKTAKQIFEELKEGLPDLDKGNVQERTESIIKCIEYAHSNLSEEAQQLLLCLVPFQSVVNVAPAFIQLYFDELKKEPSFQNFSFENFDKVVHEAIQNGFMQEAEHGTSLRLMNLQPVFTFFLKNKLRVENPVLIESLHTAFISYYKRLSVGLFDLINSTEPDKQGWGLFLTAYEYENLYQTLTLLLERQQGVYDIFRVINRWLENKKLQWARIGLGKKVQRVMERYTVKNFSEEIRAELIKIKFILGNVQDDLQNFIQARKTYEEVLALLLKDSRFFEDTEFKIAQVYQNLGIVSVEQKDYPAAKGYYQKALEIFVKFNDEHRQARVYHNLGNVSVEQKEYAAAQDYYQKALEIFMKFKEDVYSITGIANIIFDFAKESNGKAFGQAMLEKAAQHLQGEAKAYVLDLLAQLNQP